LLGEGDVHRRVLAQRDRRRLHDQVVHADLGRGERLVERGAERQERLSVHLPVQVEVRGLALALGEALRGDLPEAVQRDGLDVLVLGGRLGRLGPGRRRLGGRRRGGRRRGGGLGGGL